MTKRKTKEVRLAEIYAAAYAIATSKGVPAISGAKIARVLGVSRPTVMHHIQSMDAVKRGAMREAVQRVDLKIIAWGLANGDPIARAAPENVKKWACDLMQR